MVVATDPLTLAEWRAPVGRTPYALHRHSDRIPVLADPIDLSFELRGQHTEAAP